MTGKSFAKNLKYYLEPLIDVPVYIYDQNTVRELPCIMIGIEDEEQHDTLLGNYTLNAFVMCATNGWDDELNNDSDGLAADVIEHLNDSDLYTTLNAPLTGDLRPDKNFHLEALFINGMERRDEESSTFTFINLEAYTANS